MHRARELSLVALLSLVLLSLPQLSRARGVEACGPRPDSGQVGIQALPGKFFPYRQGVVGNDLTARDVEFLWDSLYVTGFTNQVKNTLDRLNQMLVFTPGISPVATNARNLQAVYNYLRREGSDWNPDNPRDSTSLRVGQGLGSDLIYNNADRAHVDYYVRHPSRGSTQLGAGVDGSYPAPEITDDEDISTPGRTIGDVRPGNSVMVLGPTDANALDPGGTGWTAPYDIRRTFFNHELKHSFPTTSPSELWSAAAEVVGGVTDTTARGEFPYTWPLLSEPPPGGRDCVPSNPDYTLRWAGTNYQARTAFMAYLGYNYLNADTARTLGGMTDDLLYRWAKGQSPSLLHVLNPRGLSELLADSQCATCATKGYFHPGGADLTPVQRLGVLHHNWRVANFVNNPTIAEGQFGYPVWSGFSPAKQQKAWQTFDNCGIDDIVTVPQPLVLGPEQLTRDTILVGNRTYGGVGFPMAIAPYAANYWVIRPGSTLGTTARDLVVRVLPLTCYLCRRASANQGSPHQLLRNLTLSASTVGYTWPDTSVGPSVLWQHPEAASNITGIQTTALDSMSNALEFVISGFGATQKSVLLVLSTSDGWLRDFGAGYHIDYQESVPYRLEVGLRGTTALSPNPYPLSVTPTWGDAHPAWSPAGDEVAYSLRDPAVSNYVQIFRRGFSGSPPTRIAPMDASQYAPDWSPRGDLVAFETLSTIDESNIWLKDATSSAAAFPLTNRVGAETMPAFQPNGQGLAYIHKPVGSTVWQLRYIRLNGTGDVFVADIGSMDEHLRRPRWSADGTRIYLSIPDRQDSVFWYLKFASPATTDPNVRMTAVNFDFHPGRGRMLINTIGLIANSSNYAGGLCWDSSESVPANRLALLDTTSSRRDTSYAAAESGVFYDQVRWSPDGTRIAWDQTRGVERDLYVKQVSWNRAPTYNQYVGDQTLTACQPFSMSLAATDPDNEPITILTYGLPAGAVMSGTNMLWVRPPAGTYYTIFKAVDGSGGVASKVVRFTVTGSCGGFLSAGSGGGSGGGASSRGADRTSALPGQPAVEGNSLLDGAEPGAWVSQLARVATTAADQVSLTVTAGNSGTATLDQARLLVFDHPEGSTAVTSSAGPVVITNLAPASATNSDGSPIALEPDGQLSQPVVVPAGTVVTLNWAAGSLPQGLSLNCQRPGPAEWGEDAGVDVQVNSGGQWTSVGRVYPRSESDRLAIPLAGSSTARLVFDSDVLVNGFAGYAVDAQATASAVTTTAAVAGSTHEAAVAALAAADGPSLSLGAGEQLTLDFTGLPELAAGRTRSVFLDLRARHEGGSGGATARQRDGSAIPIRFALHQNLPNPFGRGTSIRFDVPRSTDVRLEIFDAQGRRVRTLADRSFEPGSHVVAWDGRDDGGRLLGASVYLCRMAAGEFRQFRTMVMVP